MEETIILYLFWLRLQGASPARMTLCRSRLARLARFCHCSLETLDRAAFRRYARWLSGHQAPKSVATHLQVAREFLDWCVDEGYLDESPAPPPAKLGLPNRAAAFL